MSRKVINFTWEDAEAQAAFAEWVGFPGEERTAVELDQIEALIDLHPPLRVLDLGCGNGRHALELARRGYSVVGIDVAGTYLDKARREADRLKLDAEFYLQRGSELREEAVYDLVLAYNHTLGFMSHEELETHICRIRRALNPSGVFLLVLAGPRLTPSQDTGTTRDWAEKEGRFILSEKRIDEAGYRHELSIVIDSDSGKIKEFRERQRAYALNEVLNQLDRAGFRTVDAYRDLRGQPATSSEFGVFICRP